MRLLVTGASGFVGRPTLRRLLERTLAGVEVHAVTRGPRLEGPLAGAVCHGVDLLEASGRAALVERLRPTHLLHLAWEATPGTYWTSPLNAAWLEASLDLVDRALALGCRRVVAAGTCAEYAWGPSNEASAPLDEATSALAPATPYGQAKDALRAGLRARCEAAGASWAWGRIFFAYGPGEPAGRLVPSVARALLEGREAKASEGLQRRDFVHVDDVAAAFAALVDHDLVGPVNLATGVATPVRDLVLTLGRLAGRPDLVRLGAVPIRPGEPPVVAARVDRLLRELGLRPRFDLEAGLADTLRALRGL